MNNIKSYDDFILNEEINLRKLKNRIVMELAFAQIMSIMYLFKLLFFWSKSAKTGIEESKIELKNLKKYGLFLNKYELDRMLKRASNEEIKEYVEKMAIDYEEKMGGDLIEDMKVFLTMSIKKTKKVKKREKLIKLFDILFKNNKEEDPYGEEEWDDDYEEFKPNDLKFEIYREKGTLTPENFLKKIKEKIVGKRVSFKNEENILKFTKIINVKDVRLRDEDRINGGILLIDQNDNVINTGYLFDLKLRILK